MRTRLASALAALLAAGPALAKVPDPRFSSTEPVVYGNPEGSRAYRVVVRSLDYVPQSYEEVTLDFSASPVRLDLEQEPGTTVDCALRTLTRYTGPDGVATFHPRFGKGCAEATVLVSSIGVPLAHVPARSTDLDGADGCVGLMDLALFARPFLDGNPHPEMDFDGSGGAAGLGDFSLIAKDFLLGAKGTYCP